MSSDLEALLQEHRKFEPPDAFRAAALLLESRRLRARRRGPRGLLGRAGRDARVDRARGARARLEAAAREVVRRRQAQRVGQLRRPAHPHAAPQQGGARSGRASPATAARSRTGTSTSRSTSSRNVLTLARRAEGRPRGDLPADDPRGGDRDARLRAHRRDPLGGVRRLLARVAARPDQRRAGEGARSPPTAAIAAARSFRSSATPTRRSRRRRRSSTWSSCSAGRAATSDEAFAEMQEGRDHWWHRLMRTRRCGASPSRWTPRTCCSSSTRRARPASRRGSSTRRAATSSASPTTTKHRVRPQGGRRLLVHRRRRLGHRPLVSRLRSARQRRDVRDVRGRARLAGEGPLLGDLRAATA